MELFSNPAADRQRRLDTTVDRINSKFGGATIGRAKPKKAPKE